MASLDQDELSTWECIAMHYQCEWIRVEKAKAQLQAHVQNQRAITEGCSKLGAPAACCATKSSDQQQRLGEL